MGPVEACPVPTKKIQTNEREEKISRMKPQQTGPKPASNCGDRRHTDGAGKIRTTRLPGSNIPLFFSPDPSQQQQRTKSSARRRRCPWNLSSNRGFSSNPALHSFSSPIRPAPSRRLLIPSRFPSPDLTIFPSSPGALPKEKSSPPPTPLRPAAPRRPSPTEPPPTLESDALKHAAQPPATKRASFGLNARPRHPLLQLF